MELEIIAIVGGIFVLFGVKAFIQMFLKKKKCTELVYAEVISVSTTYHDEYDVHSIALKYAYDGEQYIETFSVGGTSCSYKTGDQVKLHIDPKEPNKFCCDQETLGTFVWSIFGVIFGCIVIMFIIYLKNV